MRALRGTRSTRSQGDAFSSRAGEGTCLGQEQRSTFAPDRPDTISPFLLRQQGQRMQRMDSLVEPTTQSPDNDKLVLPRIWRSRRRRRPAWEGELAGFVRREAHDVLPQIGRELVRIALDVYTLQGSVVRTRQVTRGGTR